MKRNHTPPFLTAAIYLVCVLLAVLSIMPFWIMLVNATRTTAEIQQSAVTLIDPRQ